jgi:uncharacterized Fe-S cluster-containing radical SAM superfamily protein
MTLKDTEEVLQELEGMEEPSLAEFNVEFVSKLHSSGISRCLEAASKPFTVKSGNPQEIYFLEPLYVASVEIEFSRPLLGAVVEFSVHDSLSNRNIRKKVEQTALSQSTGFEANCVTSGISILLQPTMFELLGRRTVEVKKVTIRGYTPADYEVLTEALTKIQNLRVTALEEIAREKREIQSRETKVAERETAVERQEDLKAEELADLQREIDEADGELNDLQTKVVSARDDVSRAEARKQALTEQISVHEATVRSIEGEISSGKEKLRAVAVETSEKQSRLQELTSNVNLFSEEFKSFSDHGAKQARTFIWLSLIPLTIVGLLTIQLLVGAVDLSVKYVKEPNIDLLTVFVTRLPYLTVCASILAVCYSALMFLFRRISQIYAERLDFSKIGIVAKDVTSASAQGLQLADEELYEARTYLKIEMLKSYLSGNIGAFRYLQREKLEKKLSAIPVLPQLADDDAGNEEE